MIGGILIDTIHYNIEEQVVIFLHTLAHNERVCNVKCYSNKSDETVERYFNKALDAVMKMKEFVKDLRMETSSHKVDNHPRFYPYFKVTTLTDLIHILHNH